MSSAATRRAHPQWSPEDKMHRSVLRAGLRAEFCDGDVWTLVVAKRFPTVAVQRGTRA
jgi:hypothetical protein